MYSGKTRPLSVDKCWRRRGCAREAVDAAATCGELIRVHLQAEREISLRLEASSVLTRRIGRLASDGRLKGRRPSSEQPTVMIATPKRPVDGGHPPRAGRRD